MPQEEKIPPVPAVQGSPDIPEFIYGGKLHDLQHNSTTMPTIVHWFMPYLDIFKFPWRPAWSASIHSFVMWAPIDLSEVYQSAPCDSPDPTVSPPPD